MVDWAYENIQSETVVEITENQIIEYQNRGLWGLFLKLPIIGYLDQVRGLANRYESILAVKENYKIQIFLQSP